MTIGELVQRNKKTAALFAASHPVGSRVRVQFEGGEGCKYDFWATYTRYDVTDPLGTIRVLLDNGEEWGVKAHTVVRVVHP
jgi:hypothetical protein